ncbi:MAG: hypothetical protein BWK73_32620 [Thiothrix lacustris]|uniref:Uncharacterized protein n=1 Tax=Thiothrix lacustris TaxID=525917 RepID=A0A1Y1QHR8_9GAMM|nr:MAG: hypothetical protein BWK73_32620 [Thiothrix lacustris]
MDAQLQIRHIGYQDDKPQFFVVRLDDGKNSSPVTLTPPEQTTVEGRPNSNLQQDLRWYLEKFLDYPFDPETFTAERVQDALHGWGEQCFATLFQGQALLWFHTARQQGLENLTLKIASNDPRVLAWPWEALRDPDGTTLAHTCRIERQVDKVNDPLPLPENLPQDCINILLVIARPYGDNDVGFHALSRPMIELLRKQQLPVHIDVLRPPTFDQLRNTLHQRRGFYHIVHFDGHGGYGEAGHTGSPHAFKGLQGMLIFEDAQAEPAPVTAEQLTQLIAEYRIPIMVLNACQSARIDERADDAFASVAAALLKAGIRSVVAMGYNLYVSGAQQFVPAFYQRLLTSGKVAEATRAGRQAMRAHDGRVCARGEFPLQDWLVPVLYQQDAVTLPAFTQVSPRRSPDADNLLPEEARELGDYGFIGRERAVQTLERARLQQPQAAFLIHGMAGVGKTILAKGFLHWLQDTNGLGAGAFWFSFDAIRNTEYVINELVDALFGTNARAAPLEQKLTALVQTLREQPFLLVWDNFESVSGIAGTEVTALLTDDDRNLLKKLLKQLRGGKTKVLITSRSPENWLTPQECYRLPLSGLQGEELWEYCNAVVRDLGLKIDRKNQDFLAIINELDGHPLAIRAILLRLNERSAAALLTELKQQFAGAEGDESTRQIYAALSIFNQSLPDFFAPILQLIGLHKRYVERDHVEQMLLFSGDQSGKLLLEGCFPALENAGLLQHHGHGLYSSHPALCSYLTLKYPVIKARQHAFINMMGRYAEYIAPKPAHEQHLPFLVHSANLYHALSLAESLQMGTHFIALAQSLAMHEYYVSNFDLAKSLLKRLVSKAIELKMLSFEAAAYHKLGLISQAQKNLINAQDWYKKSLELNEKLGKESDMADNFHNLGTTAMNQRNFSAAEHWFKKSLAINQKLSREIFIANIFHNLGFIATEMNDYKKAKDYYKNALLLKEKNGDEASVATTYHQLGMVLEQEKDFSEAERFYSKSLEIKEKQGNAEGAAKTYHQLGSLFQEQKNFPVAEYWCKKALIIWERNNQEMDAARVYDQLGIIAFIQESDEAAMEWFLKALLIFSNFSDMHHFMITAEHYRGIIKCAAPSTQIIAQKRWQEAGLDQTITLDQLEQQLQ